MKTADSKSISFIRLLGAAKIEHDGKQSAVNLPQKGIALLAYLLFNSGLPQTRQKLADLLWPDLPEQAGRSNLRQALLRVKRLLATNGLSSSCLTSDHNVICFDTTDQYLSDISAFLAPLPECRGESIQADCSFCLPHLESVVNLYQGHLLDDFILETCPEFEDWLQNQRERLLQRAFYLLEKLSDCFEAQGNYDRALVYATRFQELAPWNDIALRCVIRLATLNGQSGFALSQYEAFCRTLKAELGALPEPATRKLAQRIRAGELPEERKKTQTAPVVLNQLTPDAERRQVTILSCHFSSPQQEDPEDEIELLRAPLTRCKEILSRQGYIVKTISMERLLAYFGFPKAEENSAIHAVQAALAIVDEPFSGLSLSIGIHTSLVLSSKKHEQPDIIGRASEQATSLASFAGDKQVVISAQTQQLVRGYFEGAELGPQQLSGQKMPVTCFLIQQSSGASDRLDRGDIFTPLVGRKREMELLKEAWSAACRTEGKVLLLQGEAGIGKSRLLRSLQETLMKQPCRCLELRCYAESSSSPFQPVISLLKARLGFHSDDSSSNRFTKLTKLLEQHCPKQAGALLPLLTGMLSLPLSPSYHSPALSSQQQREQTMSLLLVALCSLAEKGPLLLIIEDLQWIDPTSLEMLTKLIDGGIPNSTLLLMTARPEFQSSWPENCCPKFTVGPLSEEETCTLIKTGLPDLSDQFLADIVARVDGVPLFAEELSRMVAGSASLQSPAIPASLQDLLAARLDALTKDKQIAQLAATIGRDFSENLLAELTSLERGELIAALFRLKNQGLLSISAAGRWQFRHALIRDAAYLSQVRKDRKWAHRRIAEMLTSGLPDDNKARPELLAHHWSRADEFAPAVSCWIEAGQLAQKKSAHKEALSHYNAGLALLTWLPQTQQSLLELQLQTGLGASAYAVEGYASHQGAAAYSRAVELGEPGADLQDIFPALWGLWAGASSHSNWKHSFHLAKRLLRIALHHKDSVQIQQGFFAVGNIQFWRGEFVSSRKYLEKGMALYAPHHHEVLVDNYGENAYVTSGSYLAWCLCLLGFPEQALDSAQKAVAEARRNEDPFSLGYALTFQTVLQRMVRAPEAVLELAEETVALATHHDFPLWKVGAVLKRGWAKTLMEDPSGIVDMQRSVDQVSSLMSAITLIFLETQADGLRHAGRFQEAMVVIDKALKLGDELDDHHAEAELYRLKGLCLLSLSADGEAAAESHFQKALKISRQQSALLLELRTAMALAQLWSQQHKIEAAHRLLAGVYQKFTEGFDSADLSTARKLLADLNQ